jgi:3-phytase
MAIWADPTDPSRSVVIAASKASSGGGIGVFDLSGHMLQFRPDGQIGNIDIRPQFPLGGNPAALVAGAHRSARTLAFWKLNPATRLLEPVPVATSIAIPFEPYGLSLYRSPVSGRFYVFVSANNAGTVQQWEISGESGSVAATMVRSFDVGSQSEGMAADDGYATLFVGEEAKGVWKYGAEPSAGASRTAVGAVGDGNLVADVEGLAIAHGSNGGGFLFVSSQGNSTVVVYSRDGSRLAGRIEVGANGTIDACSSTDGLDTTTANLGPGFPSGMLAVHDASNTGGTTSNLKFVPLEAVVPVPVL